MTFIWNLIGLIDIVYIFSIAIYIIQKSIKSHPEGILEFTTFLFSWIPAFAPATIVFLHI